MTIGAAMSTVVERIGGRVKRTFPTDGYCWIAGDDGVDYFGHVSQIQTGVDIVDLRISQRCSFIPTNGPKGPAAEQIALDVQ